MSEVYSHAQRKRIAGRSLSVLTAAKRKHWERRHVVELSTLHEVSGRQVSGIMESPFELSIGTNRGPDNCSGRPLIPDHTPHNKFSEADLHTCAHYFLLLAFSKHSIALETYEKVLI